MVTNLMFRQSYSVNAKGMSSVKIGDKKVSLTDIPFIRFDFSSYSAEDFNYIESVSKELKYSVPIIQIHVGSTDINTFVQSACHDMCVFLYTDVTDKEMASSTVDTEVIDYILNAKSSGVKVRRVVLVDKTSQLDRLHAKQITDFIRKSTKIKEDDIGICSSPLCMMGGVACLTAQRAREIAAEFSDNVDIAVPSANHQNTNECGCIKYTVVSEDIFGVEKAETKKPTKIKQDALKDLMNPPTESENSENGMDEKEKKEESKKKTVKKKSKSNIYKAFSNMV